MNVLKDIYN